MSHKYNLIVALIALLLLSGCLSPVGSNSEPVVRTYTPSPMVDAESELPNFGHNQTNDEITTPKKLDNKTTRSDLNVTTVEILLNQKLNSHRRNNDLSRLVSDPRLARIARHHSYDMANREYINHTSPDGVTFGDRLLNANYDCLSSRENIAGRYWKAENTQTEEELAEAFLRGFIHSPEHNTAMVNPDMTTVGIGIYVAKDGRAYVTMNLCDADPTNEGEK
ncbi:hypothetical protein GRX01_13450 [Halobaculum sp. WSA2]|uniref:SCP domain-containing protein n=1 Tax=Halobaculum saliterrae TaxID=2073113 RepID=A0A6B0T760_9EURY|nr:CAP domain-containing protein [Halobaculum saliterrae]MXR42339.1 hypothetical protein [Halobaculum saliterrae]